MPAFFTQSCPTCGRRLQINGGHAKQRVACKHCGSDFIACDPKEPDFCQHQWHDALLERADQLLALAELRVRTPRETASLAVAT